jgi:hypothetical protein
MSPASSDASMLAVAGPAPLRPTLLAVDSCTCQHANLLVPGQIISGLVAVSLACIVLHAGMASRMPTTPLAGMHCSLPLFLCGSGGRGGAPGFTLPHATRRTCERQACDGGRDPCPCCRWRSKGSSRGGTAKQSTTAAGGGARPPSAPRRHLPCFRGLSSSSPPERSLDPASFPGGTPGGGRRQDDRDLGSWRASPSSLEKGGWSSSKGLRRHTTWCGRESRGVHLEEARRRVVASVWAAPPGKLASCGCRREEARRMDCFSNSGWVTTGKVKVGPTGTQGGYASGG